MQNTLRRIQNALQQTALPSTNDIDSTVATLSSSPASSSWPSLPSPIDTSSPPPDIPRPYSHHDFLFRVATFRIHTWFAKPNIINPLRCARYGWENTAPDTLGCRFCHARLRFSPDDDLTSDSVQLHRSATEFQQRMQSGHTSSCGFHDNPSPVSFEYPSRVSLVPAFRYRWATLLHPAFPFCPALPDTCLRDSTFSLGISAAAGVDIGKGASSRHRITGILALCGWTRYTDGSIRCPTCARTLAFTCTFTSEEKEKEKDGTVDPRTQHRVFCPYAASPGIVEDLVEDLVAANTSDPQRSGTEHDDEEGAEHRPIPPPPPPTEERIRHILESGISTQMTARQAAERRRARVRATLCRTTRDGREEKDTTDTADQAVSAGGSDPDQDIQCPANDNENGTIHDNNDDEDDNDDDNDDSDSDSDDNIDNNNNNNTNTNNNDNNDNNDNNSGSEQNNTVSQPYTNTGPQQQQQQPNTRQDENTEQQSLSDNISHAIESVQGSDAFASSSNTSPTDPNNNNRWGKMLDGHPTTSDNTNNNKNNNINKGRVISNSRGGRKGKRRGKGTRGGQNVRGRRGRKRGPNNHAPKKKRSRIK